MCNNLDVVTVECTGLVNQANGNSLLPSDVVMVTPTKTNTLSLVRDSPSSLIGPLTMSSLLHSPSSLDGDHVIDWSTYEESVQTAASQLASEPLEGGGGVGGTPNKDVTLLPIGPMPAHSPEAAKNEKTLTPLPRRKMGKPRKAPLLDPFGNVIKRKRGRPRKCLNNKQCIFKLERANFSFNEPSPLLHKSAVKSRRDKKAAQLITR